MNSYPTKTSPQESGLNTIRIRSYQRSKRGALGSVVFLIGMIILLMFMFLAVDIAHFNSASTEMQSVVDAAAMMAAYDLQWNSTATDMSQATADARYMVAHGAADCYNPAGISIPTNSVTVSFSSVSGGINNACTVSMKPPIIYLMAPLFIGGMGSSDTVVSSATAAQLPIATGPAPPWFLETTDQPGPPCPAPLPAPAPSPPAMFPTNAYVTFADVKGGCAKQAPPILPTYWVELGLTSLSSAKPNPPGIKSVLNCMGTCVNGTSCNTSNPVKIGATIASATHGAYNSAISDPGANSALWTNDSTVLLPVSSRGTIVAVYSVKLTGPYVPNSYSTGQGVFGEFGVQFLSRANALPGATVFDPTRGVVYSNVEATMATLIK